MPWPLVFAAALLVVSCALALALIPRLDEALRRETARRTGEPADDNGSGIASHFPAHQESLPCPPVP